MGVIGELDTHGVVSPLGLLPCWIAHFTALQSQNTMTAYLARTFLTSVIDYNNYNRG